MLSTTDLERLIAAKRREIEKEKTILGLSPARSHDLENAGENSSSSKQVNFSEETVKRRDVGAEVECERDGDTSLRELEENIPADLERYIRRYLGLPVMLKAGEFSPNNPLIRGERTSGDALLGLGEYERRRNTLRKIRQQQYREYLDQQAKKKQEAKEQAEKERREREEKEREREERERDRLSLERERSPERRRASVPHTFNTGANNSYVTKVDTAVQVDGVHRPLSVAVQTDDAELFRLPPSPSKCQLTQAERELSPRTVLDADQRRIHAVWTPCNTTRRRSYGQFDERSSSLLRKTSKDKLVSDLRHSYMPSLFDADAIQMRNEQTEKEAAERRQFYQQELKNQIVEQQRIREERKTREKMLEQAEMRRLEEQLRMLRVAQEREVDKQHQMTAALKENTAEYNTARKTLQKEIDLEQQSLLRATSQPGRITKRNTHTSHSENTHKPLYYTRNDKNKKPYSINIPDNSIFSPNYDVDSYLRRNLNFKDKQRKDTQSEKNYIEDNFIDSIQCIGENRYGDEFKDIKDKIGEEKIAVRVVEHRENVYDDEYDYKDIKKDNIDKEKIVEKIHERLEHRFSDEHQYKDKIDKEKIERPEPSVTIDTLPVLRHSPKINNNVREEIGISDGMKKIEDKWKVPVVQKNILKSMPNDEGKNVSILTQLGSIRRQLQLEQLKLDMMVKDDEV